MNIVNSSKGDGKEPRKEHGRPERGARKSKCSLWIRSFDRTFDQITNNLCHNTNILVKILTFAPPKKICSPYKNSCGRPWRRDAFLRCVFILERSLVKKTNFRHQEGGREGIPELNYKD